MNLYSWLDTGWDYYQGEDKEKEEEGEVQVEVVESPKEIYREIEDTIRHLNIASSKCLKVEELFSTDLLKIMKRLQDLCEVLITKHSPKVYASWARDKLWKYGFYDAVQKARKLQRDRPWTPSQTAYIKAHIESGIAKLHFFIIKIQECAEFEAHPLMSHPSCVDSILNEGNLVIQRSRAITEDDKKDQSKLIETLAMCFINLGDLYRYMKDICSKTCETDNELGIDMDYFRRAQEWYTQAFLMYPSAGLPLNQLGNIYAGENWGIDSAYYLLYSSLTKNPYEGAFPNLRQHLDSKMVQFARRPALPEPKPLELLCNGYVRMLYQFLFEETAINYEKLCQEVLSNFHERLVAKDSDIDEKLLFKLASISVMQVWRLQTTDSIHTSPAVAFAMSIFFTLVTHLASVLQEHSTIYKVETVEEEIEEEGEDDEEEENASNKIKEAKDEVGISDQGYLTAQEKCKEGGKRNRKLAFTTRGLKRRSCSIPSLHDNLDSDVENAKCEEESDYDDNDDDVRSDNGLWSCDSDESDSDYSNSDSEGEEQSQFGKQCSADIGQILKREPLESNGHVKAFDSSSNTSNARSSNSGSAENSQKSFEGLKHEFLDAMEGKCTPNGDTVSSHGGDIERVGIEIEDLLKIRSQVEPILVSLLPFLRWLQSSPAVKDALAANAEKVFLENLCNALTILACNWTTRLGELDDTDTASDETVTAKLRHDWNNILKNQEFDHTLFSYQLSEDRSMLGMPMLQEFIEMQEIADNLTSSDELSLRIGRLVAFGHWMTKTDSFSMMYSEDSCKFFVPTADMLKNKLRVTKIKQLLKGGIRPENMQRLARAYKDMNSEGRRGRHGKRFGERSRRHSGPEERHIRRRRRSPRPSGRRNWKTRPIVKLDEKPICVVIDLDAALKYMEIVKRLSCSKHFMVCVPNSVFETLDAMKDTEAENSEVAKGSYNWFDDAAKRNHPGVKILKNNEKKRLNVEYPNEIKHIEIGEYFDMLECCNFLMTSVFEGNPYHYAHTAFHDHRDKYSVFYLSGNDHLLDTTTQKPGFDPIKIARSLPGVFVDCITEYPPTKPRHRASSPRRRQKWRTTGKCNG